MDILGAILVHASFRCFGKTTAMKWQWVTISRIGMTDRDMRHILDDTWSCAACCKERTVERMCKCTDVDHNFEYCAGKNWG